MIVPFAPGGVADIVARIVGQKMGESFGHSVVIDNRPGAGGSLAGEITAKAKPDGHTVLLCSSSVVVINPLLSPNMQYDPQRVLAPVSLLSSSPYVLLVHPGSPFKNVRDLIGAAKAKPGALNFGSAGVGSASHLVAEIFRAMAGIQITHVPYKGTALASNDLLSGQLHMMFEAISASLPNIRAGRLRPLGIATRNPFPLTPNIPTIAGNGVPGFEGTTWQGLCAPAPTPSAVLAALNQAAAQAVKSADVSERFGALGVEGVGTGAEEFRAFIKAELARFDKAIRDAGIKPE
ncbi:MAG: tripartite tricarboxylate transporter substrate binding protein [Burkholderiales bacterium]|nr:tripartite tricarboxylate transporter substrate binding protein [Burkholderiales bacterium]